MIHYKEYCKLELIDGIVYARYIEDAYIDLETAKAIVKARKELTNNLPHAVLICGGPINISKEARAYGITDESLELIIASAIVAEENLLRLTFYKLLFFTQSKKRKMRFFNKMEPGIKWLKERAAAEIDLQQVQK